MIHSYLAGTCAALMLLLGAGASAQDQPVIHVALSPFEAQANVYYAQDLGLLKKAGLNVDIQQVSGSAAITAGIVGGSLQIGTGSALPVEIAKERGFDVVFVAPGTIVDTAQLTAGLVAAANSPLRTASDLNGKSVGVNALQSVDQIEVEAWTDKNGGDSRTLRFVEVPPSLIVDALASGRVDVASGCAQPSLGLGGEEPASCSRGPAQVPPHHDHRRARASRPIARRCLAATPGRSGIQIRCPSAPARRSNDDLAVK